MGELYDRIAKLCEEKKVSGFRMCRDVGMQPSILTDLKMGRTKGLSAKNLQRVADYFGISVDELLGIEKQPASAEDELWELRQALHDRPELKMMFDLTKNASPAQVRKMLAMLKLLGDDDSIE